MHPVLPGLLEPGVSHGQQQQPVPPIAVGIAAQQALPYFQQQQQQEPRLADGGTCARTNPAAVALPCVYLNKAQAYVLELKQQQQPTPSKTTHMMVSLKLVFHEPQHQDMAVALWSTWFQAASLAVVGDGEQTTPWTPLASPPGSWAGSEGTLVRPPPLLEVDASKSANVRLVPCPEHAQPPLNEVRFVWEGCKAASVSLRIHCLSTDFSHLKGVKGIPLRLVVDCWSVEEIRPQVYRFACKVKTFRDKGASRKHREEASRFGRIFAKRHAKSPSTTPAHSLPDLSPLLLASSEKGEAATMHWTALAWTPTGDVMDGVVPHSAMWPIPTAGMLSPVSTGSLPTGTPTLAPHSENPSIAFQRQPTSHSQQHQQQKDDTLTVVHQRAHLSRRDVLFVRQRSLEQAKRDQLAMQAQLLQYGFQAGDFLHSSKLDTHTYMAVYGKDVEAIAESINEQQLFPGNLIAMFLASRQDGLQLLRDDQFQQRAFDVDAVLLHDTATELVLILHEI